MFSLFTKKGREEREKKRFDNMRKELTSSSDDELKSWYSAADANVILGYSSSKERDFIREIEAELNSRGFEYQIDY